MAGQSRKLKVISIDFNESDTQVMREQFNGVNGILLVAAVMDEAETLNVFRQFIPDMVVVNIMEKPAVKMDIVQRICAITDEIRPPFFIAAHFTEETDTRKDVYSAQLSKIGYVFYRYGAEHNIQSIIRFANRMASAIKTKSEREAKGIYWKCDPAAK